MSDFISLSCPSCGAKLEITQDINRFACSHCGREHIVNRSGGIVFLSPVIDAINQVKSGVDKTAAELAIVRLQKEIENLENKEKALGDRPPEDNPGFFGPVMIVLGSFLIIAGIVQAFSPTTENGGGLWAVLWGIAIIAIPIITVPLSKRMFAKNIERWEKSTGETIKFLDNQIAQKKSELKSFQDIVSS